MSYQLLDDFANAVLWSAFEADGTTPSAALGLTIDSQVHRYGSDQKSGRIEGASGALGHFLRRSFSALDLTPHEELRLWLRSTRVADGTPERPFFLELRLGSAALPIGHPQNVWQRFLPVGRAGSWELVGLALDDLPAAVRGSLTRIELRCTDDAGSFICHLDDLAAVREEMLGDVEAALLARLGDRLALDGDLVPAYIASPGVTPPELPHMRIALVEIRPGGDRPRSGEVRRDYAGTGYRVAGAANDYDLDYDVDAVTGSRLHTTCILEFVLASLAPRSQLAAAGRPVLVEWQRIDCSNLAEELNDDRVRLRFRIATRQVAGLPTKVVPTFNPVSIETEPAGSPQ